MHDCIDLHRHSIAVTSDGEEHTRCCLVDKAVAEGDVAVDQGRSFTSYPPTTAKYAVVAAAIFSSG